LRALAPRQYVDAASAARCGIGENMDLLTISLMWIALCVAVGLWAARRGRSAGCWSIAALFLSPVLAWAFLAALPKLGTAAAAERAAAVQAPSPETHVKCPDCAELIRKEARVCRHCGCRLVPQA
jgi:hypothetical protein